MPESATPTPGARRRSFLKMGLYGGGALMLGLPVVRVGLWWNRRPGDGLEALSAQEYQIVEAVAEAFFPPGGNPPESGKELNLAGFFDAQVAAMDDDMSRVVKAGLHTIEDLSLFSDAEMTPFTARSLESRQAVLHGWETSPVFPKRGMLRLFKWYLGLALVELPGMREQLGLEYVCS